MASRYFSKIIDLLRNEVQISDCHLLQAQGGSGDACFQCNYNGQKAFLKVRLKGHQGEINEKSFSAGEKLYQANSVNFLRPLCYKKTHWGEYQITEWLEGNLINPYLGQESPSYKDHSTFLKRLRSFVEYLLSDTNVPSNFNVRKQCTAEERAKIAGQIKDIAATLLDTQIIHGDIMLNLMRTKEGRCVIIDFDRAFAADDDEGRKRFVTKRIKGRIFLRRNAWLYSDCAFLLHLLHAVGCGKEYADTYAATAHFLEANIGRQSVISDGNFHFSPLNLCKRIWQRVFHN